MFSLESSCTWIFSYHGILEWARSFLWFMSNKYVLPLSDHTHVKKEKCPLISTLHPIYFNSLLAACLTPQDLSSQLGIELCPLYGSAQWSSNHWTTRTPSHLFLTELHGLRLFDSFIYLEIVSQLECELLLGTAFCVGLFCHSCISVPKTVPVHSRHSIKPNADLLTTLLNRCYVNAAFCLTWINTLYPHRKWYRKSIIILRWVFIEHGVRQRWNKIPVFGGQCLEVSLPSWPLGQETSSLPRRLVATNTPVQVALERYILLSFIYSMYTPR